MDYKFNPTEYGFAPVTDFPELAPTIPVASTRWFVKIVERTEWAYWFMAIHLYSHDDRVEIVGGTHDHRDGGQFIARAYRGLISTDAFARDLLCHLLGTTAACDALDLIERLAVTTDLLRSEYRRSQVQLSNLSVVRHQLKHLAKQIDEIDIKTYLA